MWVIINNERINLDKVVNYYQGTMKSDKDTLYIKYEGADGWDTSEFKTEEECEKTIDKLDEIVGQTAGRILRII